MGALGGAKKERDRVMSRKVHHADRNCRARDLAESIAKRRRYSVAVTSKPSHQARLTRILFAVAGSTGVPQVHSARRCPGDKEDLIH